VPTVILIRPPADAESPAQWQLAHTIKSAVLERDWTLWPALRAIIVRSDLAASNGRKIQVLEPQDTERVYRAAHAAELIVLTTTSLRIRRDPRKDPAADRVLMTLDRFLRYKAVSALIRSANELQSSLDSAEGRLAALSCDGHNDPRCLPLHVFAAGGDWDKLDAAEERRRFERQFNGPSNRADEAGRQWRNGPWHGREQLTVARMQLPVGFHWDVNAGNTSSLLTNGWEVWALRNRISYVNVSPDSSVRKGRKGSDAVKLWPR
jgi:hypothetical protein